MVIAIRRMLVAIVPGGQVASPASADSTDVDEPLTLITCVSESTRRQHCPGDTSSGVMLVRSFDTENCLLNRNWGFDKKGVWVTKGCGGEFLLQTVFPQSSAERVSQ